MIKPLPCRDHNLDDGKMTCVYGDYSLNVDDPTYDFVRVIGTLRLKNFTDLNSQLKIQRCNSEVYLGECLGLETLKGIGSNYLTHIGGQLFIPNSIKSHLVGLMLVEELESINIGNPIGFHGYLAIENVNLELLDATFIVNKHLEKGRDVQDCQEELLDFGFREFAKM